MIDRIIGTSEQFPIEHRFLNGSCCIAAVFSLAILVNNLLLHLDPLLNLIVGLCSMLFGVLYYFARFRRSFIFPIWAIMIFTSLSIPVAWFLNSGLFGSTLYICFVALALFTIIAPGKNRIIIPFLFIAEILAVIVVEYFHPHLVVPYESRAMQFIDITINLAFSLTILAFSILLVMKNYEKEKQKAEESNRLKSYFIANISHEIRTPMNSILGFSELLRDESLPAEEKHNYIEIIHKNGNHLIKLIDDLIDLSRIEAGQLIISEKPFSLKALMRELHDLYSIRMRERAGSLRLAMVLPGEPFPELIVADELRIRQVLINLIGNAVKFTRSGVIEFGCRVTDSGSLLFHVSDTGIGIGRDEMDGLFKEFKQGDESHTRQYGGAGLGLSISKKLVTLMGGDIRVESEKAKGTTFYFEIPFKPGGDGSAAGREPMTAAGEGPARDGWKQRTVLVVEDDEDSFRFLARLMSRYGIRVLRSVNGLEAVDICRNTPGIDCVLMDIQLPLLSGNDAARRIREFRKDLPIIAQSGNAYETDRAESLRAGCNDFITKPIQSEKLLAVLERFLR
ncbi:MAG TPA: ATP-binding protein [Spirochaetota bacterium]|mgnify:CR=1 FL=1|nr:ATP-binding protein [Spirochaetota bacterium]HPV43167.1 ATP-binding protein [Spirochaetota bacterium]